MGKKFINDFQQNVRIGSKHSLEFGSFLMKIHKCQTPFIPILPQPFNDS